MNLLLLLAAVALPAAGRAAPEVATTRYALTPQERSSTRAGLEIPFSVRGDRRMIGARVELEVAEGAQASYEVRVNGRTMGTVAARAAPQPIEVDPSALADRDLLTIHVAGQRPGACRAPAGAWAPLVAVAIRIASEEAFWPHDLALLPLPFVDPDFDREATVPIVFAGTPELQDVRAAGLFAAWLGHRGRIALRFRPSFGTLPPGRAVVLVAGADGARALGLEAPSGPALRWAAHPGSNDPGAWLLVLEGRDQAELERAARALLAADVPLQGVRLALPESPPEKGRGSASAGRWLDTRAAVPFSRYPGEPRLTLSGVEGSLSLPFRVAPDLWPWPRQELSLDVGYSASGGAVQSGVYVSFNGRPVGTLPPPGRDGTGRARLFLPAVALRGFNELRFDVQRQGEGCASPDPEARLTISGDSTIHFEGLPHFASVPNIASFAYDGFPLTRRPDLAETALVLAERPSAAQVGTALSLLAQLASITGGGGERVALLSAPAAAEAAGKDLVVIGAPGEQPLIAAWAERWPLQGWGSSPAPGPAPAFAGRVARDARERVAEVISSAGELGVVGGILSPSGGGRVAMLITAVGGAPLPQAPDWLGYMTAREPGGDLLLISGEQRWLFRLGPTEGVGELGTFTRLRWELAQRWYLLVPALLLGGLLSAAGARSFVEQRMRARLAEGGRR